GEGARFRAHRYSPNFACSPLEPPTAHQPESPPFRSIHGPRQSHTYRAAEEPELKLNGGTEPAGLVNERRADIQGFAMVAWVQPVGGGAGAVAPEARPAALDAHGQRR